jgi:hypothetical protein
LPEKSVRWQKLQWFCSTRARARSSRAGSPGSVGGCGAGSAATAAAIACRSSSLNPLALSFIGSAIFIFSQNMHRAGSVASPTR